MRYDPLKPVESEAWRARGETEQMLAVESYHKRARVRLPSSRAHAIVHTVVETELAEGYDPALRALERMQAEGLDRHDAVHAAGWVLARHMFSTLKHRRPFDREGYARDLDCLTAQAWRDSVSEGD